MDVFEISGTPKSSILIGSSIINHPFWDTPIFGNTQMMHIYIFNHINIEYVVLPDLMVCKLHNVNHELETK